MGKTNNVHATRELVDPETAVGWLKLDKHAHR